MIRITQKQRHIASNPLLGAETLESRVMLAAEAVLHLQAGGTDIVVDEGTLEGVSADEGIESIHEPQDSVLPSSDGTDSPLQAASTNASPQVKPEDAEALFGNYDESIADVSQSESLDFSKSVASTTRGPKLPPCSAPTVHMSTAHMEP